MASDEDYMAFLNKANEDPSKGLARGSTAPQASAKAFRATQEGVEVPAPLVKVCENRDYISDADMPFEPVALGWDEGGNGLPDEGELSFEKTSCSSVCPGSESARMPWLIPRVNHQRNLPG
jgi:hypothetical protein